MKIKIKSYGDKGSLSDERIGFEVISDCDLKFYVVFKSILLSKNIFHNQPTNTFWFAPKSLKAGDTIVLYTKNGEDSISKKTDGSTTYFFYWGLNKPIFTNDNDGIILSEMNTWEASWE